MNARWTVDCAKSGRGNSYILCHRVRFALPDTEGYATVLNDGRQGVDVAVPGGAFLYVEQFLDPHEADRTLVRLQVDIAWQQDSMRLFGKPIPLPRLTAWYGDPGKSYSYSGIVSPPNAWTDDLLALKSRVEAAAGTSFNSVLLNRYRDGRDHQGWHADDERELGRDPVIASLSLGATRDFVLRRNDDHAQKIVLPLGHGALLVMRGSLQHCWQHAVPKRMRVAGERINLTFRTIGG